MKAYFDCFAGIAGDMILGALVDLGVDPKKLETELQKLNVDFKLDVKKVKRKEITATKVNVIVGTKQPHRSLDDINKIIDDSALSGAVIEISKKIFLEIGKAEAKIHGKTVQEIHFHEVGAVDSIIDIVGSVTGLQMLNVDEVVCSYLPLGSGFVECAHGTLPLPAPATVEILKGIPVYYGGEHHEFVTPTGAGIMKVLAKSFGNMPKMTIDRVGYGAGTIESDIPNVLRVILGK